ncbi:MAG: hypothetical protein MJ214_05120 [Bacilli bacterium]|nr:hypothetical protein [Bacilli bacterium]
MKKINLFIAPIMAIPFLASCGGGNAPQPEPVIPTYTVILNASDGASFVNNQQSLCLYNVIENTPLNQIEGYAIPLSPDHLEFNHWTDNRGNVISESTPITSNLLLTSDFYRGLEFERNCVKTYIYDDLWNILNIPDWNSPFSSDPNKNKILSSFSEITTNAVIDNRLTTVAAIDAMKEFYLVLKDHLFAARHEDVPTLEEVLDDCKNQLDVTFKEIDESKNPLLFEAIIHLNISYFEVKNYEDAGDVCEYAYQALLNKIKDLSSDDYTNLLIAWNQIVRGLMLASYDLTTITDFDLLVGEAELNAEKIIEHHEDVITTLAKVYSNCCVALARSSDQYEISRHKERFDYILGHYESEIVEKKCLVDLYTRFFSAYASEKVSANVSAIIKATEDLLFEKIEKACRDSNFDVAISYCTIGGLFAEGIRKNPSEASSIKGIVGSFFDKITSDDPTLQEYRCYIKPFASFAKATSLIDFNHETFGGRPISFAQYKANADWVIEKIDDCSYKDNPDKYEAMNILSEYVAKYSDYGNYATDGKDGIFYQAILNPSAYNNIEPISATVLLPFDNAIVLNALRKDVLPYKNPERSVSMLAAIDSAVKKDQWSIYTCNKFRELYDKLNLKICYSECLGRSAEEVFDYFTSNTIKLIEFNDEKFFKRDISAYLLPLLRLNDNQNVFRGRKGNLDVTRSYDVLDFTFSQMMKIFHNVNFPLDFVKYNECIVKVLINDYISCITEDITYKSRFYDLQGAIEEKINTLLKEYK